MLRLDVSGRKGRLTFLAPFDRPCFIVGDRPKRVSPRELRARFASLAGRAASYRSISSPIDADLDILPFQLEPALAMLGGARRVLVADEVGLGKTIQAGLLIAELHNRDPLLRALILVPSSLRHQWVEELRRRFGLGVWQAEARTFDRPTIPGARGGAPWDCPGVWIASLDYIKQQHVFDGLPQRPWDLLVIDEVHGVCGDSDRHAAAADLSRRSRRLLLLTATPHSGDDSKFERLMSLGALPCKEDDLTVFRRTRCGLALPTSRRVRWHAVSLSEEEERLLDVLAGFERVVLRTAGEEHRDAALLLLSVFRKRAVSTIAAFLLSVERRLSWLEAAAELAPPQWRQGHLAFDGDADDVSLEERQSLVADIGLDVDRERAWLRRLMDLGRTARQHDSKLRRVLLLARRSTEPLAIFTEFRDSLDELESLLRRSHRIAAVHGGFSAEEQRRQLDRFLTGSASILLATDVASQGLNLQSRCRWIVNLELPWNPARLEQRAGRVDRIGQRRPVHISMLVARHRAEAGVLVRLARRTLSARQTLGPEMLRVAAPDEQVLRAHLLANLPLPDPAPLGRKIDFCRAWSRAARAAARRLVRQHNMARRWRAQPRAGRPCVGHLDRMSALRPLAGHCALVLFSVPLMNGSGALLERRLVLIRVAPTVLHESSELDRAREFAAASVRPRARRLCRLREREALRIALRERAIADALTGPFRRAELQTGLFDRRTVAADEHAARVRETIRRDLEDRLLGIETDRAVEVGTPVLELIALPPR